MTSNLTRSVVLLSCAAVVASATPAMGQRQGSGFRIAFDRASGDSSSIIYTVNGDGSGLHRLAGGWGPSWSPDGRKIAFVRGTDVFVMNADGGAARRLTREGYDPSWSSDGRTIAFASDRYGNDDIYLMNADGTDVHRVRRRPGPQRDPAWSSDSQELAFDSASPASEPDIYVMSLDGSGLRDLTRDSTSERDPAWSANGQWLAFQRGFSIYRMNADGSDVQRLTRASAIDGAPAWSTDSRIAFARSNQSVTNSDIYVMNADGSGVKRITAGSFDGDPAWQPGP